MSRLSKRMTKKPWPASSAQKSSCQAIICVPSPITSSRAGSPGSPNVSYASSRSPTGARASGMAEHPSDGDASEPAEDGLRQRPLPREVLAVGGPGGGLGDAGLLERVVPVHVPVAE